MNEFLNDVERFWDNNAEWIWIALAIVVAVVVLGALIGWAMAKKRSMDRRHAEAIRVNAARDHQRIEAKDAETRGVEAEAEQARAEADRLELIARERREEIERDRRGNAERLREADRLDHGRSRHFHRSHR